MPACRRTPHWRLSVLTRAKIIAHESVISCPPPAVLRSTGREIRTPAVQAPRPRPPMIVLRLIHPPRSVDACRPTVREGKNSTSGITERAKTTGITWKASHCDVYEIFEPPMWLSAHFPTRRRKGKKQRIVGDNNSVRTGGYAQNRLKLIILEVEREREIMTGSNNRRFDESAADGQVPTTAPFVFESHIVLRALPCKPTKDGRCQEEGVRRQLG